jgi:hypothetical protein
MTGVLIKRENLGAETDTETGKHNKKTHGKKTIM